MIKYLKPLIMGRSLIFKIVITVTLISVVVSFLIIKKYTATATILPPNPQQETMFGMMSATMSGGLSNLGRMSGLISGSGTASDLFAAIMQSGRIKGEIINKYDLKRTFKSKTLTDAGKMLDDITTIEVSGEGIVSVSVIYRNKKLAADIANSYVEELDKFNKETAMTVGKKYRIFIEERLKGVTDDLAAAEESLRIFQEKNHTVALDDEIKSAITVVAQLKGEIMLREAQKGAIESFNNTNNPYVQNIDNEIKGLRDELSRIEFGDISRQNKEFGAGFSMSFSKLPEIALRYTRLLRDVKVQEVVYELLTQQYEQAKIMEVKDTPTVQFLDRASPPEKKSYPRQMAVVVYSAIFSLLFSIFLIYFLEYYHHIQKTPEWQDTFNPLKDDIINLRKKIFKK